MKPDERTKFLKWYDDRTPKKKELNIADVDILRRSMIKIREDFIKLENIDPLRYITQKRILPRYFNKECNKN